MRREGKSIGGVGLSALCENRKLGVNIDSLADYSLRSQYPGNNGVISSSQGSHDGEIRMFRRAEKGYVYKWSVSVFPLLISRLQVTHGSKLERFLGQKTNCIASL